MADDPLLTVDSVDVFYGTAQAVHDVSLEVGEGEIVGVIGPNGAGKTTLFDAIAGFIDYNGTITYRGTDLATMGSRDTVEEGLIYCTEGRDLFPYFSVHENLQMGAQFRTDRDAVKEDFDLVYDLFPRLADRRTQDAATMSGGERQMLALGRALMGDPTLLLLDEPTLGLAPIIIEDIGAVIERLNDEGLTILLAEQNATFALEHADRLALLEQGSVELEGTATEFRNNDYVIDAYVGIL